MSRTVSWFSYDNALLVLNMRKFRLVMFHCSIMLYLMIPLSFFSVWYILVLFWMMFEINYSKKIIISMQRRNMKTMSKFTDHIHCMMFG